MITHNSTELASFNEDAEFPMVAQYRYKNIIAHV